MKEVNPWALHRITEVLLEAEQRGLWNAKPETKQELQKLFMEIEGELEGCSDLT
ncbi:cobaltochelatase subunit CobN [Sporomusa ovata DSM 2662]|uniref:CobN component of cobalt chelatase involved in B12 biosynthesis n=1 Tax=Sporomusa ovata TaxID=2378 RepID=A0A0U1L3Y1_9FIRM|nr:cobalamin biosynthesis protein CobN [Sporomusa ovata DSM 2662]CQR74417.1 CobN component of cobalt chelatase involved in B12 biosynthesis [Sporomusa ovata]